MAASVGSGLRLIVGLVFVTCICLVYSHTHSHEHHGHAHDHHEHHDAEPKHYKYSKQANAHSHDFVEDEIEEDHGHAHHESDERHADHGRHPRSHEADNHGHAHDHGSHGNAHDHGHAHDHGAAGRSNAKEQGIGLWIRALGSTALVSSAPVLILLLIPLDNTKEHEPLLKTLLAFAAGGLLGDAFLHLIPHALSPHSHGDPEEIDYYDQHGHGHDTDGHAHDHGPSMTIGLWVLIGIISFLSVEKFVRFVKEEVGDGHSHGSKVKHSSTMQEGGDEKLADTDKTEAADGNADTPTEETETDKKTDEIKKVPVETLVKKEEVGDGHSHGSKVKHSSTMQEGGDEKLADTDKSQAADENADMPMEETETDKKTDEIKKVPVETLVKKDMKVAAYLNLAADAAHNFTDGLAIGVSYMLGQNIGILTTITILLHEVPHEVGDFAILIQSGCSKRKAMMLQFTTAIGAMMGTVVSLLLGGVGDAAMAWILPFTAGGFIYIACVSVIPELLENCNLWQTVKELTALVIGVLMMVIIAGLE